MRIVVFLLSLVTAGCATTSATRLGTTETRPAIKDWKSVSVYRTPDQVPGEYEEVALLSGTGDEDWGVDEGDVINSMKKKAASLGANAIILDSETAVKRTGGGLFSDDKLKGQSIAIFIFETEGPGDGAEQ